MIPSGNSLHDSECHLSHCLDKLEEGNTTDAAMSLEGRETAGYELRDS